MALPCHLLDLCHYCQFVGWQLDLFVQEQKWMLLIRLGWGRLVFSEYFQKVEQNGKYILVQPKYWGCQKPLHDLKISIKVLRTQFENLSRAILYQSRNGSLWDPLWDLCMARLIFTACFRLLQSTSFWPEGQKKGYMCICKKEIRSSMQALWVRIFIINI